MFTPKTKGKNLVIKLVCCIEAIDQCFLHSGFFFLY